MTQPPAGWPLLTHQGASMVHALTCAVAASVLMRSAPAVCAGGWSSQLFAPPACTCPGPRTATACSAR
eukprot:scaffold52_cov109-Isochrysis_galbana.AAC.5